MASFDLPKLIKEFPSLNVLLSYVDRGDERGFFRAIEKEVEKYKLQEWVKQWNEDRKGSTPERISDVK